MSSTTNPEQTPEPAPTFDVLPLTAEVRRAIDEMGFVAPTPVQRAAYGPAVEGHDLVVQARTGTGKTAAFGIPLVDRLVRGDAAAQGRIQALILAPTRELALQSAREIERLGKYRNVAALAVYGGAPIDRQINELAKGAPIVSGTPGRVLDLLKRGAIDPAHLKVLILDEADEMLSMGFARELSAILELLPAKKQVLFFSATIGDDVKRMADRHMRDPQNIALSSDAVGASTISHFVYMVSGQNRTGDLIRILEVENPESAVVFCNTKAQTEHVAQALEQAGFEADWLNGDLPQGERERVMARTKKGELRYLVATDVAARGIDISHLTHVINHDFPDVAEQYIHRTGRTGRAGRTGTAISLVAPQDIGALYYLRLQSKIFPIERTLPSQGELRTRMEMDRVQMLAEAFQGNPGEVDRAVAKRLLVHEDAERLIAGLLSTFFGVRGADVDDVAGAARRAKTVAVETEGTEAAPSKTRASSVPRARRKPREDAPEERSEPRRSAPRAAPAPYDDDAPPARTRPAKAEQVAESPAADREDASTAMVFLGLGRREGVRPGDISKILRDATGLDRNEIGRIRIRDKHTFVAVPADKLDHVLKTLQGQEFAGKTFSAEQAKAKDTADGVTEGAPVS